MHWIYIIIAVFVIAFISFFYFLGYKNGKKMGEKNARWDSISKVIGIYRKEVITLYYNSRRKKGHLFRSKSFFKHEKHPQKGLFT